MCRLGIHYSSVDPGDPEHVRLVALKLNPAEMHHLLDDPSGPVGVDLQRRAQNVTARATDLASDRPGPEIRTGDLHSSIHYVILSDAEGLRAQIGTDQEHRGFPYPRALELGFEHQGGTFVHYPFLEPALEAFDP